MNRKAIRLGKVKMNTARLIRQRTEPKGRKRFLSRQEYDDLLIAIEDRNRKEEFIVSVLTGMRLAEQYTVEWWQVDLDRNEINLTKTKNGDDRTVMLNSQVSQILAARKPHTSRKDKVFPRSVVTFDTRS